MTDGCRETSHAYRCPVHQHDRWAGRPRGRHGDGSAVVRSRIGSRLAAHTAIVAGVGRRHGRDADRSAAHVAQIDDGRGHGDVRAFPHRRRMVQRGRDGRRSVRRRVGRRARSSRPSRGGHALGSEWQARHMHKSGLTACEKNRSGLLIRVEQQLGLDLESGVAQPGCDLVRLPAVVVDLRRVSAIALWLQL